MLHYATRFPIALTVLTLTGIFVVIVLATPDVDLETKQATVLESDATSTREFVNIATTTTFFATTTTSTTSTSSILVGDEINVPSSSNSSVIEGEWYPQSPTDCFTGEAEIEFGHPGMCLRFFHQGF